MPVRWGGLNPHYHGTANNICSEKEKRGVAISSKSSSLFLSSLCLKRDNQKIKEEEDKMALCISTENVKSKIISGVFCKMIINDVNVVPKI